MYFDVKPDVNCDQAESTRLLLFSKFTRGVLVLTSWIYMQVSLTVHSICLTISLGLGLGGLVVVIVGQSHWVYWSGVGPTDTVGHHEPTEGG